MATLSLAGFSTFTYSFAGGGLVFNTPFALGVLSPEHVQAYVVGELDGLGDQIYRECTYNPTSGTTTVVGPLPNPCDVVLQRTVPKDVLFLSFASGADVTRTNIDVAVKYTLMALHETLDGRWDNAAFDALNDAVTTAISARDAAFSALYAAQVNAAQSQAAADVVVASADVVAAQTVIVEAAAGALTAVAQNRILGRKTAGPGPVEQLTASDARTVMGLGTAATTAAADYATAAQGGKADTAVQPAAVPSQADVAWINGASAIKGVVGPNQIQLAIAAQVATLRPDWTVLGPTATTSGTFVDFTIPAGVTEMEIIFNTVSCNGTNDPLVRLGVAGAILATAGDYASTCGTQNGGGGVGVVSNTTGFIIFQNNATSHTSGRMKLSLIGNVWIEEGVYSRGGSSTESAAGSGYSKALAGPIDRVRVTSTISNTFDLGSVIVRYK